MQSSATRIARVLVQAVVVAAISPCLASGRLQSQDLSGRWLYEELGQTVELQVRQDRASGRATGTFSMFGQSAPFSGVVTAGSLVVQQLGDVRTSAENGTMTGRLQGGTLMFTIAQPGQSPVVLAMTRRGDATTPVPPPAAGGGSSTANAPAASAPPRAGSRAGSGGDFAGKWQLRSEDGTSEEVVELEVRGTDVTGEVVALEHGYFSKRTTVKGRLFVRGTLANGVLQLRAWNEGAPPENARRATGRLRGEYFVLDIEGSESAYARPGRPLVQSAEGSPEAAAIARAVTGRVYSTTSQAGGRGGSIAGGRMRLALCADGRVEYDASDVASAGGGSMGSTVTRRGTWTIVLYAGTPMVRAEWQGTGTSYSLIGHFRVRPDAAGRSANVDGVDLPNTGRC